MKPLLLLCALLIILSPLTILQASFPSQSSRCCFRPTKRTATQQDIALLEAARDGNTNQAEQLIKNGANINYQDEHGWSPLIAAAKRGHETITQLLLSQQHQLINANLQATSGRTALIAAASEGHAPIVLALIKSKLANLDHQDKKGWTALIAAGYKQHDNIIRILIANGANYRLRTHKNQSFVDIINDQPSSL